MLPQCLFSLPQVLDRPSVDREYDDIRRTMRLVDLTAMYHQGNDVGGPVDAVQLNNDGSVEWYKRKPNCPEN